MTQEFWKPIKGYPHLLISRTGRVWTTTYDKELRPHLTNRGYLRVNLSKEKTVKRVSIHRLVAEAFIPNPDNLPAVDHIDGNKLNNNVENLQWISNSDNTRKACKGKVRRPKPIICIETGRVYLTIKEANRDLSIPEAVLSAVVRGEFPSYHGLHFEYYGNADSDIPKGYITTREYAEKNNLPISTVKTRIYQDKLPHIKIGEGNQALNLIKENEPWVDLKRGRKA